MIRIIETLSEVSSTYDGYFVDLWGCVHDGIQPFDGAVEALRKVRANGGFVVLVTNAPRHRTSVEAQLEQIGVPRDCWDTIATSGDSARAAMFRGYVGSKVWFMGEAHDRAFFDPMAIIEDAVSIPILTLSWIGARAVNGAQARLLSFTPRWAERASISASHTHRSMTLRAAAWRPRVVR